MKRIQDVILGGLIVLLAAGLIHWLARPDRGTPLQIEPLPTPGPLMIYIVGEVIHPGVYPLPQESRINDAVLAAGGLTENANQVQINLAGKLKDGQKVIIPSIDDNIPLEINEPRSDHNEVNDNYLININSATQSELEKLPGIGPGKASQIITYRSENGPFDSIEDIQKVPGIGMQIFRQIETYLTVE